MPGVSAERFDVAALPFGVERVVGKRAFARPRRAGDDGHRTRFNIQVQVAKVVLTGSADSDGTNVCSVGGVTHGKSIQVLEKDRKLGRKKSYLARGGPLRAANLPKAPIGQSYAGQLPAPQATRIDGDSVLAHHKTECRPMTETHGFLEPARVIEPRHEVGRVFRVHLGFEFK